ncbi:MAG: hypothetical protein V4727_11000 [Verrucomicrobiota bacterium]
MSVVAAIIGRRLMNYHTVAAASCRRPCEWRLATLSINPFSSSSKGLITPNPWLIVT